MINTLKIIYLLLLLANAYLLMSNWNTNLKMVYILNILLLGSVLVTTQMIYENYYDVTVCPKCGPIPSEAGF